MAGILSLLLLDAVMKVLGERFRHQMQRRRASRNVMLTRKAGSLSPAQQCGCLSAELSGDYRRSGPQTAD